LEKEVLISSELSVWMEVKYIPILNKSKKVTSVLFSARDISAKKRSEQKMKDKNLELEKINTELDKFVYRAAHDLRAPLSSVLGLINLSEKEKEMPLIRQYIEMMKASIDRLNKYISDVIDYSANARLEIASTAIDVEKIIQNVLDDHLYMEGAKEMVNEVNVNGNGVFMSDPKRVEIILNNIVSNAIKYRDIEKDENHLNISADISSSSTKFVIEDNGIGIHESQKEKIFDFFYRGNERSDGSGIGLYIVKEAVDRLGGEIVIESEHGKGSTFTINIPNQKSSE